MKIKINEMGSFVFLSWIVLSLPLASRIGLASVSGEGEKWNFPVRVDPAR